MEDCSKHSDCTGNRKCINLMCGDPKYFSALQEMKCERDDFCQVGTKLEVLNIHLQMNHPQDMLTGKHCCFDIRGGLLGWQGGDADWDKKCCSNEVSCRWRHGVNDGWTSA